MKKILLIIMVCFFYGNAIGGSGKKVSVGFYMKEIPTVKSGDELEINFGKDGRHPNYFAIENPDKEWFYLIEKDQKFEFIPVKKFSNLTKISFPVGDYKGVLWKDDGKPYVVPVFVKSGKYLLYFADNLGTESDDTFWIQQEIIYQN